MAWQSCRREARSRPIKTAILLDAHPDPWQHATRQPFLDGVRDGSLPPAAFATWLVQDYHFAGALLRFQSLLLARAPRADQAVLAGGLVALVDELAWFEAHAQSRGLSLEAPRQPVCRAYGDFLVAMAQEPYVAAITALWAVERAYRDAWTSTRPGAPAFREYVDHWTVDAFSAYVAGLESAADTALSMASADESCLAEEAFVWTVRYEADFWQMAFTQPQRG